MYTAVSSTRVHVERLEKEGVPLSMGYSIQIPIFMVIIISVEATQLIPHCLPVEPLLFFSYTQSLNGIGNYERLSDTHTSMT